MKENKYDDDIFFKKYSEMNRSKNGLDGAGEWSELQKLLPIFKNKCVLDLGCGYGWHCKYATDKGANSVLGIDLSQKMLEVAKKKNSASNITYQCAAMEDLDFEDNIFDIVLSSLAFHYVMDFEKLIHKIARWIKKDGQLIFSVEHPIFTSQGTQDWFYDAQGNILHFPVDRYYYERQIVATFLGEKVIKYHRTLTTYLNTLLKNDFEIIAIVEPQPPIGMLNVPSMKNEMRRPMMLLVSAIKK